jgi:hypothetical protein
MNTALPASSIKDPKFRAMCALVAKETKRLGVPGAAIGVWHKGGEYTAPSVTQKDASPSCAWQAALIRKFPE